MNGIESMIDALSEQVPHATTEYMGEDGFIHCSVCNGKLQTKIDFLGKTKIVRCVCDCIKKEREAQKERERKEAIERQRQICFSESNMATWTFENDDRNKPKISDAMKRYVDNFPNFKKDGRGILLWGAVGTGKTYYAASVANALIDNGYSVLMTNFARLSNQIQGTWEKNDVIDDLSRYSLLILDDLGAERKSEYMQEIVFNIIDSRYRTGLPFFITTNLSIEEIKKPVDISCTRIYDRILERCFPIEINGESRRRKNVKDTFFDTKEILGL
jgi:DNA replication protein DnaC